MNKLLRLKIERDKMIIARSRLPFYDFKNKAILSKLIKKFNNKIDTEFDKEFDKYLEI